MRLLLLTIATLLISVLPPAQAQTAPPACWHYLVGGTGGNLRLYETPSAYVSCYQCPAEGRQVINVGLKSELTLRMIGDRLDTVMLNASRPSAARASWNRHVLPLSDPKFDAMRHELNGICGITSTP